MMNYKEYKFDEEQVFKQISDEWKKFMLDTHSTKCVIGISGGIDSTCVAALACKTFGKENVIGISLPKDGQKDMEDVDRVFAHLEIKRLDFDIGDAFCSIINGIENSAIEVTDVTRTNLPARLRMASLYAFSQSIPGSLVINTCNLSEDLLGWNTFCGDNIGSYAPIKNLTKTEVRKLAKWLGVPENLVMKTPIDGLQPQSDEERFGFTYDVLDNYIRTGKITQDYIKDSIESRYAKNKFKLDIIDIQGPKFDFPDYVSKKEHI